MHFVILIFQWKHFFLTVYSFALAELLLPAGRRYTFMYPSDLGNQAWDCKKISDLVSLDPRHNFRRFAANSDEIYFFVTKGVLTFFSCILKNNIFKSIVFKTITNQKYEENFFSVFYFKIQNSAFLGVKKFCYFIFFPF